MQNLNELFDNIYNKLDEKSQKLYRNITYGINTLNKKTQDKIVIICSTLLVGGILYSVFKESLLNEVPSFNQFPILLIFIIIFGGLAVLVLFTYKVSGVSPSMYVKNVIEEFIKSIDIVEDADLSDGKIEYDIYRKGKFPNYENEAYASFSHVKLNIENIKMEISNLKTYSENSEGESRQEFEGLLLVGYAKDKIIDGYVQIFRDPKNDGKINIKKREDRVILDSTEFENEFEVYAANKIEAMQVLTPDVMTGLLDRKMLTNLNYEMTITENLVIMRIFTKSNFLSFKTDLEDGSIKTAIIKDANYMIDVSNNMKKLINLLEII